MNGFDRNIIISINILNLNIVPQWPIQMQRSAMGQRTGERVYVLRYDGEQLIPVWGASLHDLTLLLDAPTAALTSVLAECLFRFRLLALLAVQLQRHTSILLHVEQFLGKEPSRKLIIDA